MSTVRRRRLRAALPTCVALVAAVGVGCGGDKSTGPLRPADETCPAIAAPICSSEEKADANREAVADLVGRIAPKLDNPTAREPLITGLGQLAIELGLGNVTAARRSLTFSREALASAMANLSTYPGDGPDLGVIDLTLDQSAILLGMP